MAAFRTRTLLGFATLLVAAGALAQSPQVYRYVDSAGRVVYSDRPPPSDAKNVQTKRMGANLIETNEPGLAVQLAANRFPATLFTFECGNVCQDAESLLNRRGVPFTIVDVQKDEQGMIRMKSLSGEERAPVLALGDKLIVKGYNEARWQAALDEAGYPKAPPSRRGVAGARPEPPPAAAAAPPPPPTPSGTQSVAPPPRGGDYPK